jgi:hypothetical protein
MKARQLAPLLLLAACVRTQLTPLAGFSPSRPPTCWQAVKVFTAAAPVDTPYVAIAYLHTDAAVTKADQDVVKNMRQKAATAGANGLIFGGIQGVPTLVGKTLMSAPSGTGTAIWLPRDSISTLKTCADTTG